MPSYPAVPPELAARPRTDSGGRDVLTFSIGTEEYALGIECIREIIKNRPITEVPRVPPFIAGIISVRGVVMPVLDMRIRLRMPPQPLSDKARILVVTQPGMEGQGNAARDVFGMLVDRVHHVVRLHDADIEPPTVLTGREVEFVAGIGRLQREAGLEARGRTGMVSQRQQQMIILLDLGRVLTFEHTGSTHGPTDRSPGLSEAQGRTRAAVGLKEKAL
ncbi:MAG: chemotaxis protein CheW [Myxococcales bacterium]|nr:chemotaxis protein CheW [Myxococcota bacterium]MDW8281490.1 chemotaxis protein CheW [Myxococcales bacterium]